MVVFRGHVLGCNVSGTDKRLTATPQHMRKNVYEEQLFRSEDERFELDMVIECGASAIRAMAPLAAQLAPLPPDVKANWRLPPVRQ